MSTKEFILKLIEEGREYLKIILPALLALHIPAPKWMKDEDKK
jgi:hypothetical protein